MFCSSTAYLFFSTSGDRLLRRRTLSRKCQGRSILENQMPDIRCNNSFIVFGTWTALRSVNANCDMQAL